MNNAMTSRALAAPVEAETLSDRWSTLHAQAELVISEDEAYGLRALALASDDDLVSYLLLKKLRLARQASIVDLPPDVVTLNSFVHFRFNGNGDGFAQLLHPSAHMPAYAISVTSLIGAGLIGLREGQQILWPTAEGELGPLCIAHVDNDPESTLRKGSMIR